MPKYTVLWNEWTQMEAEIELTEQEAETMESDELLTLALEADPTPGLDGGVIDHDPILLCDSEGETVREFV